jgi:Tfp pilus assembly protein PilN
MEILIIIVLVIGGWLFYNSVDKLNKYVAWLNKEIQEIQTKVREIDGMMKKLSQKDDKQK